MARTGIPALVAATLALLLASPAEAKLFTVDTDADGAAAGAVNDGVCASAVAGGACTLRAAVEEANGTTGNDEIALPARNYALTLPTVLTVTTTVTINGEGARTTAVDAGGDSGVFSVKGGSVVIRGVAITGGASSGGGIYVEGASTELILDGVDVHGNSAGGAGNQFGGGIFVFTGGLIVRRSAIRENTINATTNKTASGGGLYLNPGSASAALENTTIAGNQALGQTGAAFGGGLDANDVPVTLRHVTLTG